MKKRAAIRVVQFSGEKTQLAELGRWMGKWGLGWSVKDATSWQGAEIVEAISVWIDGTLRDDASNAEFILEVQRGDWIIYRPGRAETPLEIQTDNEFRGGPVPF